MGRQRQWFLGIVLTAFLATVFMGVYPLVEPSFTTENPSDRPAMSHHVAQTTQSAGASAGFAAVAQEAPQDAAPQASTVFRDPAGRYEIALLDGYQTYNLGSTSVIEAPDGSLAYTVMVVPTFEPNTALTDAALAQLAREVFQQGEGFITKEFQTTQSGIKVNWQGRVTTRGTQPLSGSIFARQEGDRVFLLMIAAAETGQPSFDPAVTTLTNSLQVLTP